MWTGSRSAPRRLLVKDGFLRPTWFTTGRPITDARYKAISAAEYHMAHADGSVLAHIDYGGDNIGIMKKDFEYAANNSNVGVLVVGPQEIAAQIAKLFLRTVVFALKDRDMELSEHLAEPLLTRQIHRIDVDIFKPGAWSEVHAFMLKTLGLPVTIM